MEVRLLRYAVTLAEELHFGRAAERNHISQQPFGQYIRRLEREVGTRLFERTSRRVAVTPEGARFVAEARLLLEAVDQLAEHARSDGAGRDEEALRLGVLGFGAGQVWDDLHTALKAQVPGLRIDYLDLDWASQYRAVLDHTVDAGIAWYAGPVDGLRADVVLSMPRVVVAPAKSPLAEAASLTLGDVDGVPWLGAAGLPRVLREWLGPAAEPGPRAPVVRHPAAIPTAVATSGYIGVHGAPARDFYPRPDVRFVSLDGDAALTAVVTRADDERPTIAALRRAARFARGAGRQWEPVRSSSLTFGSPSRGRDRPAVVAEHVSHSACTVQNSFG
ncbi:LysR family transcriptional regulator [Nonomuraea sp. K274]|uniref:LysR family transcriptional regulator n=1 Tax=Nonomuraea cypriaca TaxID=1187855 RepID=A0A931AP51_9ACTN|nr:LysR family transcriptional regulator [Nonomuraea cypriaca]MBF8194529.1 LysR family transcriptional regulator [Nonomuraea cypriaca]